MNKKIAILNQRYGLEVNGGSEFYTRLIAEKLVERYDVEILTTKAIDYVTWDNYYNEDIEIIHGITVRRFPVDRSRDMSVFGDVNTRLLNNHNSSIADELNWVKEQGPLSTELITYIKQHKDEYDVFIFVTYLYYHSIMGIPEVSDKVIFIPTAHDEPYIYFKIFKKLFNTPRCIIYLTDEEKKFVEGQFHNEAILNEVMGVGIDVPDQLNPSNFKEKYNLSEYIIYVGRIDESKGCKLLFKYFLEYKKRNKIDLKLVLMGKAVLDIPNHPDILTLGFVSEEDKFNGIAGAKALVLPSQFESLSIAVLEAMAISVPVIVNGKCNVLKGHCIKSNGGLYYYNYYEFEGCLEYLLTHQVEYKIMKQNAKSYVDEFFAWDVIMEKFDNVLCSM